jgi:hypothetical protein
MSIPEHFELEKSSRWLFLATPWLAVAFVLFFTALPFLPDDGKPKNEAFLLGLSGFGIVMFGVGAWYSIKIVQRLPLSAITVDNEGLWPTVLPRQESIVKWIEITRVRERPSLQRLELIDSNNEVRARLEYQIKAFEHLRAIVLDRAALEKQATRSDGTYAMPWWHHPFSIGSILGFSLLGWYVGDTNPLVGYGGMTILVAVIAWEYWTIPYRLRLTNQTIELAFPGRTRSIPKARVLDVQLTDDFANQMRRPHVVIQFREPEKPIHIKGLGLPSTDLHQILKAWRAGDASQETPIK